MLIVKANQPNHLSDVKVGVTPTPFRVNVVPLHMTIRTTAQNRDGLERPYYLFISDDSPSYFGYVCDPALQLRIPTDLKPQLYKIKRPRYHIGVA